MHWRGVIVALLTGVEVAGAATVNARLVRASSPINETNATTVVEASDACLKDIEPALRKKFGYLRHEQIGVRQEPLVDGKQQKLELGQGFVVFATGKTTVNKEHELDIEWYCGKVLVVKSTVKMTEGASLLINGPPVGKKLIVLALTVNK